MIGDWYEHVGGVLWSHIHIECFTPEREAKILGENQEWFEIRTKCWMNWRCVNYKAEEFSKIFVTGYSSMISSGLLIRQWFSPGESWDDTCADVSVLFFAVFGQVRVENIVSSRVKASQRVIESKERMYGILRIGGTECLVSLWSPERARHSC